MRLTVNGDAAELADGTTVAALVADRAEGQRRAMSRTSCETPLTVGRTTRTSGTRSRSRISASSNRGPSRPTSPRRDPGRHSSKGASGAMPWASRKAAASAGPATGSTAMG